MRPVKMCMNVRMIAAMTGDGELVLEDPEYCASVSFTVGSWIEMLSKYADSAQ